MIRILLVEDNVQIRELLVTMLNAEPELNIVGDAYNGRVALDLLEQGLDCDLVLTDLSMPVMDGIELSGLITKRKFPVKILMLTMHAEPGYLMMALNSGVHGYLLKDQFDLLVDGIKRVAAGEVVISRELRNETL